MNRKSDIDMKNIFKALAVAGAAVALFASCDTDLVKAEYTGDGAVSFAATVVTATEIEASETVFNVPLCRSNASEAKTVSIKATLPDGLSCPSSVTFNAGEFEAFLPIDIAVMEVGNSYKGTLEIEGLSDEEKAISISSTAFTLAKAFTWISLGTGLFYEGFWEGFIGEAEVFQAEGFDRWKIINPYKDSEIADVAGPATLEFWSIGKDSYGYDLVKYDTFYTPYDYDGGGNIIKGYWPSDLSANYAAKEEYNGFWDDDIIVFDPCWYIDGLGGWPSSHYFIAFCMPGRSVDSFIEWINEAGI